MHPGNYAAARRGTTTTGEFIGGGPFGNAPQANPYVDTLWGVPVSLSTTVGLGTAVVGAFADGARLYNRGGVTLEASNSHASYFQSNLVMLRAEARQALAGLPPRRLYAGDRTGHDHLTDVRRLVREHR